MFGSLHSFKFSPRAEAHNYDGSHSTRAEAQVSSLDTGLRHISQSFMSTKFQVQSGLIEAQVSSCDTGGLG